MRGLHEGGVNCLKYLKRSGTEKKEGETKILKRRGILGEGVGALNRVVGAGTPLQTMIISNFDFGITKVWNTKVLTTTISKLF